MGHIHVCDVSAAPCDDPEDQMVVATQGVAQHFLKYHTDLNVRIRALKVVL
jgi:hypothetical protein